MELKKSFYTKGFYLLSFVFLALLLFNSCRKQDKDNNQQPGKVEYKSPAASAENEAFMKQMRDLMDKLDATIGSISLTGNYDRDFAGLMIEHHQTSIDMIGFYSGQARDSVLKKFAIDLLHSQESEKAALAAYLRPVNPVPLPPGGRSVKVAYARELIKPVNDVMDQINSMQPSVSIDLDFARVMKAYIDCGMQMTDAELKNGSNDSVRSIASRIKTKRLSDLEEINNFLK